MTAKSTWHRQLCLQGRRGIDSAIEIVLLFARGDAGVHRRAQKLASLREDRTVCVHLAIADLDGNVSASLRLSASSCMVGDLSCEPGSPFTVDFGKKCLNNKRVFLDAFFRAHGPCAHGPKCLAPNVSRRGHGHKRLAPNISRRGR